MFFSNGNVAVFDTAGEQMEELQEKSTYQLFFEWLESKGIDPCAVPNIEIQTPNGLRYLNPIRTEGGWNYSIAEF